MPEKPEFVQHVIPVVYGIVAAEQGQLHQDGICGVNGDVEQALSEPEKDQRAGKLFFVEVEINCEGQGNDDLKERASGDHHKLAERPEEEMPCFVDDEIYAVNHPPMVRMRRRPEKICTRKNRYRDSDVAPYERLALKNLRFCFHLMKGKEKAPAELLRAFVALKILPEQVRVGFKPQSERVLHSKLSRQLKFCFSQLESSTPVVAVRLHGQHDEVVAREESHDDDGALQLNDQFA